MKGRRVIIAVLLHGAVSAVVACAGLRHGDVLAPTAVPPVNTVAVAQIADVGTWAQQLSLDGDHHCWLVPGFLPGLTQPAYAGAADAPASAGTLHELPPAPSSLSLGLTALAGLGLYQAGRSVRKLHLSNLPEWYHTGGPAQVGHATPLDLDIDTSALPLCVHATPTPCRPHLIRFVDEAVLPKPFECIPLAVAPRGPPQISSPF